MTLAISPSTPQCHNVRYPWCRTAGAWRGQNRCRYQPKTLVRRKRGRQSLSWHICPGPETIERTYNRKHLHAYVRRKVRAGSGTRPPIQTMTSTGSMYNGIASSCRLRFTAPRHIPLRSWRILRFIYRICILTNGVPAYTCL